MMLSGRFGDFMCRIFLWIARATGIGYKKFGPLVGNEVDVDKAEFLRIKSDKLVRDVARLEAELRKIGFRVPPARRLDH